LKKDVQSLLRTRVIAVTSDLAMFVTTMNGELPKDPETLASYRQKQGALLELLCLAKYLDVPVETLWPIDDLPPKYPQSPFRLDPS
jgi:hypothetical protein